MWGRATLVCSCFCCSRFCGGEASLEMPNQQKRRAFLCHHHWAEVVAAKLRCKLSIFRILRYQEEEALQHWNWYLYCLTLDSHYFAQHSISGARCAVRMPMDSVDMYLLARILKVQIVVSQLWEPALCFSPREEVFFSVHLVTHGGLWAAALQPDGFSLSDLDKICARFSAF